ncbi:MAG: hypothetical protein AAF438_06280 [Pseudomonadota bacterium]
MKLLGYLQSLLSTVYDLNDVPDVRSFVFSDRELLRELTHGRDYVSTTESLLIAEQDSELFMSLFLNDELLARLKRTNPVRSLDADNANDFWAALEGVSHFVYVANKASQDRRFSLLELELQAEIDKFIASLFLLRKQGKRDFLGGMHRVLFERTRLVAGLDVKTWLRYHSANAYAARYCWQLFMQRGWLTARCLPTSELRAFYDLSHPSKIRHIDNSLYGLSNA